VLLEESLLPHEENRVDDKTSLKTQETMGTNSTDSIVTMTSGRNLLRVRVINQGSKLFKDLVVDIRDDLNLFETVYDNNTVKKANIRKWGKKLIQQVKSGSHEIRCSVWDDEVDAPCNTFTIDEMKRKSTRELYHLIGPEADLIKLVLQCTEKTAKTITTQSISMSTSLTAQQHHDTSSFGLTGRGTLSTKDSKPSISIPTEMAAVHVNESAPERTAAKFNHPVIPRDDVESGAFRCPFSGVAVDESVFDHFRDLDSKRLRFSNYGSQSSSGFDAMSDLDENDSSTIRTETARPVSDAYSVSTSVITVESSMRVKISNKSSKRYKYLVVDIKPDLTVYEAIYEHKGVKSAQVRKWTPDVVKAVRKKTKEIQCLLLDGGLDGNICQTYSLDDLKKVSTKDIFDLAPKSNPVQLLLRCVDTQTSTETVASNSTNNGLRRTNLQKLSRSASVPVRFKSGSETSMDKLLSSTKRSRPNHMNLFGVGNATFGITSSLSGSKTTSSLNLSKSQSPTDNKLHPSGWKVGPKSRSFTSRTAADFLSTNNDFEPNVDLKNIDRQSHPISEEKSKEAIFSDAVRNSDDNDVFLQSSYSAPVMNAMRREPRVQRRASVSGGSSTRIQEKLSEFKRKRNSKLSVDVENESVESFDKTSTRISNSRNPPVNGANNERFQLSFSDVRKGLFSNSLSSPANLVPPYSDERSKASSKKSGTLKELDKINRFLTFGANRKMPIEGPTDHSSTQGSVKKAIETDQITEVGRKSFAGVNSQLSVSSYRSNVPPISEIEVVKGSSSLVAPAHPPSIPMSGDLVKEVFPYHVVIDEDFQIVQIGNSLSQLMENVDLIGKCISDVFVITGPIPSFGEKWDWTLLDKMKGKIIFFEGISENSWHQTPKLKGSIIELYRTPRRQVLFTLSPNVKNLSELESMNLSMRDLPIHSCQRDAVLLGEHSKSEVKLTNHLDHLHRELIDSMEKQIEDRTNELAKANRNLELANAQLASQKAKQLEHFACMSHEIRTPLNCIVGMSSLLLEDSEGPSMDPMHTDSIRMINTSGELLRAVVDDVLDYAKLESGSFEVDIKSTKLQDTVDSVLYSISQKFKEKNVRLRPHFTPTVPEYLETDNRRLQQVLFNLLGNAGKFSKPDSVIDLSVNVVKASSLDDPNKKENGNRDLIQFSIRDYGKGIDKKDFETIFQPFSQASKETQNIYGGTGLGLSITSKLVHRLGGTISLDSELGKYADFTVALPLNGKSIDVENISNSLKNTTIVLIEPKLLIENSPMPPAFKGEPIPLNADVVEVYGLNVLRCNSLEELKIQISEGKDGNNRRHFTLLVHETLHQYCSPEKLKLILGTSQYALISYGANFLVEKTKAYHLKSLTGLFPATLLASISQQISAQSRANGGALTESDASSSRIKNDKSSPSESDASISLPTTASMTKETITSKQRRTNSVATPSSPSSADISQKTEVRDFKRGLKVLYAEDNLVNQKVLTRVLNRYGISDVTIVDNGKKAVDISATIKYDCILLDIQMPVMGGMEACKLITERDPDAIIIFVTAHALDEFRVKAKAAGAKGFISKPFRIGDIDSVLTEIYTT